MKFRVIEVAYLSELGDEIFELDENPCTVFSLDEHEEGDVIDGTGVLVYKNIDELKLDMSVCDLLNTQITFLEEV